jgi:hypothetical protein
MPMSGLFGTQFHEALRRTVLDLDCQLPTITHAASLDTLLKKMLDVPK